MKSKCFNENNFNHSLGRRLLGEQKKLAALAAELPPEQRSLKAIAKDLLMLYNYILTGGEIDF